MEEECCVGEDGLLVGGTFLPFFDVFSRKFFAPYEENSFK